MVFLRPLTQKVYPWTSFLSTKWQTTVGNWRRAQAGDNLLFFHKMSSTIQSSRKLLQRLSHQNMSLGSSQFLANITLLLLLERNSEAPESCLQHEFCNIVMIDYTCTCYISRNLDTIILFMFQDHRQHFPLVFYSLYLMELLIT